MTLLASEFDKSTYLRGDDLKRDTKVRIKTVTDDTLKNKAGKPEKKLILWFTNHEQGLVLNKTNLRALKGAFGDDTSNWINKVIAVFPVMTEMGPGLRVRIPPPKQPTAEAAPVPPPPLPASAGASPSGNGAAAPARVGTAVVGAAVIAATAAAAAVDPELDPDPVKLLKDDLEDEIPF